MKSEGVVFIILRKSFSVFSVWSVDFFSCLRPEIYHRNLDGIYAETKSLTKISIENALEYLAFGENFIMDRLTARNLNENLENNL